MNISLSLTDVAWLLVAHFQELFHPLTKPVICQDQQRGSIHNVSSVAISLANIFLLGSSIDCISDSLEGATPVVDAIERTPAVPPGSHGHPVYVNGS